MSTLQKTQRWNAKERKMERRLSAYPKTHVRVMDTRVSHKRARRDVAQYRKDEVLCGIAKGLRSCYVYVPSNTGRSYNILALEKLPVFGS